MSTDTILASLTSDRASNAEALSQMIQTSARAKSSYIASNRPNVFAIEFPSEKSARDFQDAFESFAHASKRTVKRVRAKEREERASRAAAQKDCEKSYLYGRSP